MTKQTPATYVQSLVAPGAYSATAHLRRPIRSIVIPSSFGICLLGVWFRSRTGNIRCHSEAAVGHAVLRPTLPPAAEESLLDLDSVAAPWRFPDAVRVAQTGPFSTGTMGYLFSNIARKLSSYIGFSLT